MHKSFLKSLLIAGTAAMLLVFGSSVFAQSLTTSGLNGTVTDQQGKALGGATVTVVHDPSGTTVTTPTRANGQFYLSGLRVGGPYTVTASATGYATEKRSDMYLELGQSSVANFSLAPADIVKLETFNVTAARDITFGSGRMGPGTSLNADDLEKNVASVRRSVQDVARLDSRMYLGSLDQGGQLSAQGQNFRFNSFLIDGVQANDSFGLSSNGYPSIRSPVPLEALEAINMELNPYDVRKAGFTGALINAVTKSGTNEFHGLGYYEKTNENMRAKNPVTGVRDEFSERTYGGVFGGPIIKNRTFVFGA